MGVIRKDTSNKRGCLIDTQQAWVSYRHPRLCLIDTNASVACGFGKKNPTRNT